MVERRARCRFVCAVAVLGRRPFRCSLPAGHDGPHTRITVRGSPGWSIVVWRVTDAGAPAPAPDPAHTFTLTLGATDD